MATADLTVDAVSSRRMIGRGLVAAAGGAAIGAAICVGVSLIIPRPSALITLIIGLLSGAAVRWRGPAPGPLSGSIAASMGLLGCVAAKLVIVWLDLSRTSQIPLIEVATGMNPLNVLRLSARPWDTLFYSISVLSALLVGSWRRSERK